MQQVIGHGLAARLSARLGEGMVNGLLTARLGLLTIDLVRPLPFHELPRPALNDLAGHAAAARAKPAPTAPESAQKPDNRPEIRLFLASSRDLPLYAAHLTRGLGPKGRPVAPGLWV